MRGQSVDKRTKKRWENGTGVSQQQKTPRLRKAESLLKKTLGQWDTPTENGQRTMSEPRAIRTLERSESEYVLDEGGRWHWDRQIAGLGTRAG